MATQARSKPGNKAPVTKHPLFPAVVALWFGALFGLGSLAVRSSLIESLVLSLSLDVLLPAAAPPLGLKFRIILALLMAALGIAIGAIIARRIARPKVVEVPRRRTANSRFANRQSRAEAAVASLSEPPAGPSPAAARRRPLTVTEEVQPDQPYDGAPLPGGAPHILDVTQIDLSQAEVAPPMAQPFEPIPFEPEVPLDLSAFDAVEPQQDEQAAVAPAAATQPASPEPIAAPVEPQPEAPRQEFHPPEAVQSFAPTAQFAPPEAPRQEFRVPEAVQSFDPPAQLAAPAELAPALDRPFDAAPQPIKAPLDLAAQPMLGDGQVQPAQPEVAEYARMMADLRHAEGAVAPGQPVQWSDEAPADAAPVQWSDEPPAAAAAVPTPVEAPASIRLLAAELVELSPVELVERLAMAMRQRSHKGPVPESLVDAVATLAAPTPGFAPLAAQATENPPPVAQRFAAPVDAPPAAAAPATELLAAPPAAIAAPEPEVAMPAERLALPAALRPIDFNDFSDQDDLVEPFLPPRSFAAPLETSLAPERLVQQPAPQAAAEPEAHEADVAESEYSSLLEIGRPLAMRQDFVRIVEPETDDSLAIEPVVIFPGHSARAGTRFAAPEFGSAATGATGFAPQTQGPNETGAPQLRRFDAPAAQAAPSPAAVPGGLRQDPEETERALRGALATLQRMSGAA